MAQEIYFIALSSCNINSNQSSWNPSPQKLKTTFVCKIFLNLNLADFIIMIQLILVYDLILIVMWLICLNIWRCL